MKIESLALGWLGERAVIHFPEGVCGRGKDVPGIYVVPRHGRSELLLPVNGAAAWTYGMWGG